MMTPEQGILARHALGLPNAKRRSYRNRFTANAKGTDHKLWSDLVAKGLAEVSEGRPTQDNTRYDHFCLTRAGAEAALFLGESLDPEDFPSEDVPAPATTSR